MTVVLKDDSSSYVTDDDDICINTGAADVNDDAMSIFMSMSLTLTSAASDAAEVHLSGMCSLLTQPCHIQENHHVDVSDTSMFLLLSRTTMT